MLKNVEFIKSAMKAHQWPNELPGHHVVMTGRSNVGKSSLINALTNNKRMAKVSQRPGKTQTVNFFLVDKKWQMIDLPGYGYASVHKERLLEFSEAIEDYLINNKSRKTICMIVDIRQRGAYDQEMFKFIRQTDSKILIIANKADKLSNNTRFNAVVAISREFSIPREDIFVVSAETKFGLDKLEKAMANPN